MARTYPWMAAALCLCACIWLWPADDDTHDAAPSPAEAEVTANVPRPISRIAAQKRWLGGSVLDGQGAAIEGALVCFAELRIDLPARARDCVRSGPDGGFEVEVLDDAPLVVSASKHGYTAGVAADGKPVAVDAGASRTDLVITLRAAPVNLRGTVVDALGGPVAGAAVHVVNMVPPVFGREVLTDDDGHFECNAKAGPVSLTASAEAYAPATVATVVPSNDVRIMLSPGGVISGRVEFPDGTAATGVQVTAGLDGEELVRSPRVATSDHDGAFRLDGLAPGRYTLVAKGPEADGRRQTPVALSLGGYVRDVVITVQRATLVRGQVLIEGTEEPCPSGLVLLAGMPDPTQPFPTVYVEAGGRPLAVPTQAAQIGAGGSVSLRGVPTGTYYAVVRCDDHVFSSGPAQVVVADPTAGPVAPITWRVQPATELTVHIVDGRGAPVAGAPMRLLFPPPAPGLGHGLRPALADANGDVVVPGLAPGDYVVQAVDPAFGPGLPVPIAEGQPEVEVTLALFGSGALDVRVTDTDGSEVDNLSVVATPRDPTPVQAQGPGAPTEPVTPGKRIATQRGGGHYLLSPLPQGDYGLTFSDGVTVHTAAASDVHISEGEHATLDVVLDRGAQIRGRVLDGGGEGVANVWVTARPDTAAGSQQRMATGAQPGAGRVMTDVEGHFSLGGLSGDARYSVRASRPDGSVVSQDGVAAGADALVLTLPDTGRIEGQVIADGGDMPQLHVVEARFDHGRGARSARVRPDNSFSIEDLPLGEVTVRAATADGRSAEQVVALSSSDEPMVVALRLGPPVPMEER